MSNMLEVKVKNVNMALDTVENITVSIQEGTTITELLTEAGAGWADLSKYYPYSGFLSFNLEFVPFIVSEGQILYDVPFEKVNVVDFLDTHSIAAQEIEIHTGYPWSGGVGPADLATIWNSVYPVLETWSMFASITGFALKDLVKYLRSVFEKRKKPPQVCFDVIYSRTMWNHHELASMLQIEPDRTKQFLRVLGYEYDQSKKIFIASEKVPEIKEKLTNVKSLDI